jgi:adenylate cyclase
LRMAAERTIELNPLSTAAAYMGTLLATAGDWDRGIGLIRRAIELHPHHYSALYHCLCIDHYRRGEYDDALAQMKRSTLSNFVGTPILIAAAAGQLHNVTEARAAFDALRRTHPTYVDPDKARFYIAKWTWDDVIVDQLVDGFLKAKALVDEPA